MSIAPSETFGGTFPFAANYFDGHGFRQHYVDEGPHDGETIVCLHGEPTWGYLYRNFIGPLSADARIVVPDHMGFAKSDTPADGDYTLATHVANLEALCAHLDLGHITFVVQDWGGAMAGAYTLRNPARVRRLVLMNTYLGYGGQPAPELSAWFTWIKRHHDAGTLVDVLGDLASTVLSVMKIIGFQNSAAVTDDWLDAYAAPFPDRAACVGAIAFPLDYLLGRIRPFVVECLKTGDMPALLAKPAMLACGMEDRARYRPNTRSPTSRRCGPPARRRPFLPGRCAGDAGRADQPVYPDDLSAVGRTPDKALAWRAPKRVQTRPYLKRSTLMKFGLFGGAQAVPGDVVTEAALGYHEFGDYIAAAERLGYSSAWLVEHHFTGFAQLSATLNYISYLAGRTTTIRLGSAVVVVPWHNPILLAEQVATVDQLSRAATISASVAATGSTNSTASA